MSAYYFALEYNQGDNVLNEAIVERLQYDEEKGIAGNNRTSEVVDIYFEDAIRFNEIWNGWGAEEYLSVVEADPEFVGAGYKVFLLRDGIVGAILIFLFYFLLARVGPQKKKLYLMLLLYAFCFLQRAYPTWEAWIFPFALGAVATTVSSKEKNGQKVTEA